jgi:hypothetical protein
MANDMSQPKSTTPLDLKECYKRVRKYQPRVSLWRLRRDLEPVSFTRSGNPLGKRFYYLEDLEQYIANFYVPLPPKKGTRRP